MVNHLRRYRTGRMPDRRITSSLGAKVPPSVHAFIIRHTSVPGVCVLLLAMVAGACERPFVDQTPPQIEFLKPDLREVQTNPVVQVSISVTWFRSIRTVRLNGLEATQSGDRWEARIILNRGLTLLDIEVVGADDEIFSVTEYALHFPFTFTQNAPDLPEGRGGHSATYTRAGLLVIGGAQRAGGAAQPDAYILPPDGNRFVTKSSGLHYARAGHTATRLPDGRVLILGGSRVDNPAAVEDLIEHAEFYDPEADRFTVVPVEGQPIRRTLHTAKLRAVDGEIVVDLYGGRGDTRYGSDPFMGVRRDLRSFAIRSDTVFARNTIDSAPYLEDAIFGHTATQLNHGPYLILGTYFDGAFTNETSFLLEHDTPTGLQITPTPSMLTARTRHAAATLPGNMVVIVGGRQATPQNILVQAEIYSDEAGQFFRVPLLQPIVRRFGHTATNSSSQRILLVGGFGLDGTSYSASEFFHIVGNN